jgi:hypothetical protein
MLSAYTTALPSAALALERVPIVIVGRPLLVAALVVVLALAAGAATARLVRRPRPRIVPARVAAVRVRAA